MVKRREQSQIDVMYSAIFAAGRKIDAKPKRSVFASLQKGLHSINAQCSHPRSIRHGIGWISSSFGNPLLAKLNQKKPEGYGEGRLAHRRRRSWLERRNKCGILQGQFLSLLHQ